MKNYLYRVVEKNSLFSITPYYYSRTEAEKIAKTYNREEKKHFKQPGTKAKAIKTIYTA